MTNAAVNLEPHNSNWRELADLLASEHDPAGMQRRYPADPATCSVLQALGNPEVAASTSQLESGGQLQAGLESLLGQMSVFESISRCPILAITGLLNAGKSSLLASYLSPENRGRVLRGLGNKAGTHRFVLWLPRVWWEDAELLSTLVSYLTGLFGHAPEHLSDGPHQAALQYNGRIVTASLLPGAEDQLSASSVDPLSVPLIAYDSGLDELRLGLIDCPDIQTGFLGSSSAHTGDDLAGVRRQQLAKVGRLCSAFVVLSKLGSLHDESLLQILTTLRDVMPGVPRLLAVNKVKARYAPEVVYDQARGLVDRFGISAVFAAYDFRSSLAASRIPPPPTRLRSGPEDQPQPIFFETAASSQDKESGAQPQLAYLHDLGQRLDAGTLSRESSRSLQLQLKTQTLRAVEWLQDNQRLHQRRCQDAWQAVADACYEFMAERDSQGRATGLRLQASPAIIAQMADSLQRTSPMWMRVSLSIDRTVRQLHQAISNSAARFKILQSASESVTQFTKRFRRGEGAQVVTPQRLAEAVRGCDVHDTLQATTQEQLVSRAEMAMKRFADEDQTLLDRDELDAWSRQVWQGMSFKDKLWKGTQPLAVVMAPLLAAVLVPFDAGGSAVLVFASTKELLAAAGIAAVMTPMATGGEALGIVHRETPWRQLSDLFVILCDSIGLPRPTDEELPRSMCAGASRRLLPSTVAHKPCPSPAAISQWDLNAHVLQQLQIQAQQLT